jgi:SAM-dependent methyltransferase
VIIFWAVWGLAILLVLSHGSVLLFGAPYVPTLNKAREDALDLLNLKKGQQLVDLGCGDGGMLIAAAKRGVNSVGYEINPFMAFIAWTRTRKYHKNIKIKLGNFWKADISNTDAIFVFLLDRFMSQLDDKVKKESKAGVLVVSHAFKIPGKMITAKKGALLLYKY